MKKVYYTAIHEDRQGAIDKAKAVLSATYPDRDGETLRVLTVKDGTVEIDGVLRHPDTRALLPAGTRAYIIEANVPGDIRGYRTESDGPLPTGITPPGQGGPTNP